MNSNFDNNHQTAFDRIKDFDEQIYLISKPQFLPFLLSRIEVGIILITVAIAAYFFNKSVSTEQQSSLISLILIFVAVMIGVSNLVYKILIHPYTFYAYSEKRVLIRTGIKGREYKTIEFDKIIVSEVKSNYIERFYKTGTIRFFSGITKKDEGSISKVYDEWECIQDPYEVFKAVKEAMSRYKVVYHNSNRKNK